MLQGSRREWQRAKGLLSALLILALVLGSWPLGATEAYASLAPATPLETLQSADPAIQDDDSDIAIDGPGFDAPSGAALQSSVSDEGIMLETPLLVSTADASATAAAPPAAGQALTAAALSDDAAVYTVNVPYRPKQGTSFGTITTAPCRFAVVDAAARTCAVYGEEGSAKAISGSLNGWIEIPRQVTLGSATYTVTEVADYAFGDGALGQSAACSALSAITLPATIQKIGSYAFAYCSALANIYRPLDPEAPAPAAGSFTPIAMEERFTQATAALPAALQEVGRYAFYYAVGFDFVTFAPAVESLDMYAFCQANGLKTVEFEGDAPVAASYCFTGQTRIAAVIYGGDSLGSTNGIFNSDTVPQPDYYNVVRFYRSQEAAEAGEGLLGSVVVERTTTYKHLHSDAPDDLCPLYRGAVPAYPEGTNIWRFQRGEDRTKPVNHSQYAWADYTDSYDLAAGGTMAAADLVYRGEDYFPCAAEVAVCSGDTYETETGTRLEEGIDYTVKAQRRNALGQWADTEDTISIGQLRIVVNGMGLYQGELSQEVSITFDSTAKFLCDIPSSADPADPLVSCAFAVTSLNQTTRTGTVSVTKKTANRLEEAGRMAAVDIEYDGGVYIPETIQVQGYLLTVTKIDSSAFCPSGKVDNAYLNANLSAITLPKTITSIGNSAFARCSKMKSGVFYCDFDGMSLSNSQFLGCGFATAVFYGKRPKTNVYPLKTIIPAATVYYTIRFVEDEDEYEAARGSGQRFTDIPALSSITVREGTVFAELPTLDSASALIYSGSIPEYPNSAYSDFSKPGFQWGAPTWRYPDVDIDQRVAMVSGIQDSTIAYAANDALALYLSTGLVVGVEEKQYDYTGYNVFDPLAVKVYPSCGGLLERGVDYKTRMEYKSPYDSYYSDTDECREPGSYRFIVEGIGTYGGTVNNTITLEFSIYADESPVGSTIISSVTLQQPDGTSLAIPATMKVTRVGPGRTVALVGSASGAAIYGGSLGSVTVPERITYGGLVYAVAEVGSYAFNNCAGLTSIALPATVTALGSYAFRGCAALDTVTIDGDEGSQGTVNLPQAVTEIPDYAFSGCTALGSLRLHEGIESIGSYAFQGCGIDSIDFPSTLVSLGERVFSQASNLATVTLNPQLADYPRAFYDSLVQQVVIAEGAQAIPDQGFYYARSLKSIELPASLASIGSQAFYGTALTEFTVTPQLRTIGDDAFANCTGLATVIFADDANMLEATKAFAINSIRNVVYRAQSLVDADTIFTGAPVYYSTVSYYGSEADRSMGLACGQASFKMDTPLSQLTTSAPAASLQFDGAVPALPAGSPAWLFPHAYSLGDALGESCAAVAADPSIDATDLSHADVITQRGYAFTGASIQPIETGTASVVLPNGKVLTRTVDYTWEYQRQTNGVWAKTLDVSSAGALRIKVTPVAGRGYTGTAYGYFTIVTTKLGATFTVNDPNGNAITYKVTRYSDGNSPGEVQVGTGSAPMSINAFKGEVIIPESVVSPSDRYTYVPTAIGAKAFYRQVQVTAITIPSSVTTIYRNAFAYEEVRGDTKSSNLTKVVFNNDVSVLRAGYGIFLGCDLVDTVIYGSKKGRLEQLQPFVLRPGVQLTRYYTVTFYEDEQADPLVSIIIKEGSYPSSISNADYYDWENEDTPRAPKLEPDAATNTYYEWLFESSGLDDDDRIIDSMAAYKSPLNDDSFRAMVKLTAGSQVSDVPCYFTPVKEPEGDQPGEAIVGLVDDGRPAIGTLCAGKVTIPQTVTATKTGEGDGAERVEYTVVAVGAFAFGASFEEEGCTLITGVELPPTIREIDQGAFLNCKNLMSVDGLPDEGLLAIGAGAFSGCAALGSLVIPDTVESIGASAFAESGLVRIELPSSLADLGKRAFYGCPSLQEAVFGGAYTLSLPAVSAATAAAAASDRVQRTGTASRLLLLDDYAFSACPALNRLVFELDAGSVVASDTCFLDSSPLRSIYYGGKKALIANGEAAAAAIYYTVNYFDDQAKVGTSERMAHLCLKAGSTLGSGVAVSGSRPSLPAYHEWVCDFDSAAPLSDSGTAYRRLIPYKLDASAADPSFHAIFSVNGLVSSTATYGQQVTVTLSEGEAVKAQGFSIVDSAGKTVLSTKQLSGSFTMPGSAVRLVVAYSRNLTVEAYTPTGALYKVKTLSIGQLEAAAAKHSTQARYSGWGRNSRATMLTSRSYVTLPELFSLAAMRFDAGCTVIFENSETGSSSTVTYGELYDSPRYTYPQIDAGTNTGRTVVAPALCIDSSTEGQPDMACAYRLAFGQTAQEFDQLRNTVSRWMEQIDKITLIMSPEDLSKAAVGNVAASYSYTGAAIRPVPKVYNADGKLLAAGTDYTVSYGTNIVAGTGTVKVTGMRDYTGSRTLSFKILRAQPLNGSTAAAYAYTNALETYPQGSKGVIVVSSSSYTEALAAPALSAATGYPILYTAKNSLSAYCTKAIAKMKSLSNTAKFRIIVVGSVSAISKSVYTKLKKYAYNSNYISRIAGNDRYLTANAVCNYGTASKRWGKTAIVVSGKNYYDAMAIAGYSAWKKAPVLLCKGTTIDAATLSTLKKGKFTNIVVVGNTKRVSAAVVKKLKKVAKVTRLSGATRYSTSTAVAKWCVKQGMAYNSAVVASGTKYSLGLAAGTLAGARGSIMLLTANSNRSSLAVLASGKAAITHIYFAGGTAAVSSSTRKAALAKLGWNGVAIR